MGLCFSSNNVVSGSNCKQTNRKPNSTTKTETVTLTETLTLLSLQAAPLPTLPFDLVAEILCRIPVKLLIQLRCLCKSFNSLISDPKFAEKHLRLSTKHRHLMLCSWNNQHKFFMYDFPIHSVFSNSSVTQTQLTYPISLKSTYGAPLAVCSCAGILCLTMRQGSAVLWNPSIRMFKILPTLNYIAHGAHYYPLYSFGYDHFINNYKIIAISFFNEKYETRVYTLGTDSWRKIQDFPNLSLYRPSGVFVGGAVNWLVYDGFRSFIVSLDLEKESYQYISPPVLEMSLFTLGVLKDCLLFSATNTRVTYLVIWVMMEYGNKESWAKLHHIPLMGDPGLWVFNKVLHVSEDDQLLLDFYELGSNKKKLVVYGSKIGTLKIPKFLNADLLMEWEVFVESLISPCS
ncbi:putative F-box domain-containing protein [Medicago truncatula]|uniref:Putative F-box domain-containing protein n=1 Tax=Medicago truncatula TaxID=3880 RepID=A0A396IN21_MEDTR|nr:F-box/kelch-repeat protein At3g23880-like [Medicago truncatula]RHN66700.1 putative F-box domain-containing protein [Medicago truncatula]